MIENLTLEEKQGLIYHIDRTESEVLSDTDKNGYIPHKREDALKAIGALAKIKSLAKNNFVVSKDYLTLEEKDALIEMGSSIIHSLYNYAEASPYNGTPDGYKKAELALDAVEAFRKIEVAIKSEIMPKKERVFDSADLGEFNIVFPHITEDWSASSFFEKEPAIEHQNGFKVTLEKEKIEFLFNSSPDIFCGKNTKIFFEKITISPKYKEIIVMRKIDAPNFYTAYDNSFEWYYEYEDETLYYLLEDLDKAFYKAQEEAQAKTA